MSTLRSALDELQASDLRLRGDGQLASDLDELEHAGRVIEVERARRLAEVERRGSYASDGHLSVASWLAWRHRLSHSTAAAKVRVARALESMPATANALASGEVSTSAVGILISAREACPEAFAGSEHALVDAARTLPVEQLKGTVAHWRESADAARAAEDERRRFERRAVSVSPTLDGMVESSVRLDPENGQTYMTALRAAEDAEVRSMKGPDARTPAQRRADALGEICRRYLDSVDRPLIGGERPHVVVTIDLESLEGRLGRRSEFEDLGRVSAETARRWACDANVTRVITDGASQPLDVGRRTKVVPPALRRAVVVRDRSCAFPNCDRPPSWCDAHHVHHWADGGETALDNLVLLCRRHHRLIHHRAFRVEMVEGNPVFFRRDGAILESDRAPPVSSAV